MVENKYKDKFYEILEFIRNKHPNLRISILKNYDWAGTYDKDHIKICLKNYAGPFIDWIENSRILLHEYCHFLRDHTCSKSLKCKVEEASDNFEKSGISRQLRWKYTSIMAREEYLTDLMAFRLAKKWHVPTDSILHSAALYNYSIKFGFHINNEIFPINQGAPKRRLSLKEAAAPLPPRTLKRLYKMLNDGDIMLNKTKWRNK